MQTRTSLIVMLYFWAMVPFVTGQTPARFGSVFDPTDFTVIGALSASSGEIQFDTDALTVSDFASPGVIGFTETGREVAVFCFSSINITGSANVTFSGDRPLALLSQGSATIDVVMVANGADGQADGSSASGVLGGYAGGKGSTETVLIATDGEGPGAGRAGSKFNGGGGAGHGGAGGRGFFYTGTSSSGGPAYDSAALSLFLGGSGGSGGHRQDLNYG
ncbi:hypothetical protein HQ520_18225, partial [bacterium]|nr:hypothetical protein [bacterium]